MDIVSQAYIFPSVCESSAEYVGLHLSLCSLGEKKCSVKNQQDKDGVIPYM